MLPLHSSLDCHNHADATSGSKLVNVHASSCHHCLLAYLSACACSFWSWFHFFTHLYGMFLQLHILNPFPLCCNVFLRGLLMSLHFMYMTGGTFVLLASELGNNH